ncbi:RICIN domain-containing protein [Pseudomonas sp. P9_31]|uniref:RICIN domain-containing protein n=1 Tax=Pseudomonas sp. P9_31 TaxID=3043448 RepID=UPI002A359965|nr:RICIN domain-containing protein [Pseudomonas sp. P9_31]WPN58495.1 RICIN domain-containing protein [Pseudomonas sp. P9_31]
MSFDPRQPHARVMIQNIKSGRYLSIEGDASNWPNDNASLTIRDRLDKPTLENPQVWQIIQFRSTSWVLFNQYSMRVACIRGQSTGNGATVIQYHTQGLAFQEWDFKPLPNGNWLIRNINSGMYIGPQDRSTANDRYCIQWDDQTEEDSYQKWQFNPV